MPAGSTDEALRAAAAPSFGAARGAPRLLLQLEGGLVLAASTWAYGRLGGGWLLFALLLLTPDAFMLGYFGGPRLGAAVYNTGHTYLAPAALAIIGWSIDQPLALTVALIWTAHIGLDRLLGFGLKYPAAFGHTHLSRV